MEKHVGYTSAPTIALEHHGLITSVGVDMAEGGLVRVISRNPLTYLYSMFEMSVLAPRLPVSQSKRCQGIEKRGDKGQTEGASTTLIAPGVNR